MYANHAYYLELEANINIFMYLSYIKIYFDDLSSRDFTDDTTMISTESA